MIKITLKNYRCFKADSPARIEVRRGFTAFVGPNNAGKSTLLRFFYELRYVWMALINTQQIVNLISSDAIDISFQGTEDPTEIFFGRENDSHHLNIDCDFPVINENQISRVRLSFARNQATKMKAVFYLGQQYAQITKIRSEGGNTFSARTDPTNDQIIDILPFIETMQVLNESIYVAAFRNAIHVGSGSLYDLPIGTAFIDVWDNWKAGADRAAQQKIQAITDELAKIFGFTHLEINKSRDGNTLQVVADKNPQRLREFGSGFSQFLIVFAQVAIMRPSFLLIDEPELNLHPSLQVRFLTALANYTKCGVIFATHSIGLARTVTPHIYSICRQKDGRGAQITPFAATKNFIEFLGEMSFSTFSDVGYDTVLCVEGPSEIITLQEFLRKLNKEHRIALMHLGGSSMICKGREQELAELRRFSKENKIAILIDSEQDQEGEQIRPGRQAFINDCEALGYKVHVTAKRAIENYFPEHAIQSVLGSKYRALQPYEKLEKSPNGWKKMDYNWRIAKEMTKEELLATDFGEFLNSL